MANAQKGNTVKVHYTGKLDDGNVFDSSQDGDPLEFVIGSGQIIPAFEEAVIGMDIGQSKTFQIESQHAYGDHNDQLLQVVNRDILPENIEPKVGQRLSANDGQGNTLQAIVTDVSDDTITVDANHPLAGEDLNFDITLVDIAGQG